MRLRGGWEDQITNRLKLPEQQDIGEQRDGLHMVWHNYFEAKLFQRERS
jgi:hypothetical protein